MTRNLGLALCCSYWLGLLATGLFNLFNSQPFWLQWFLIIFILSLFYIIVWVVTQRLNYRQFKTTFWLLSASLTLFGIVYLQMRIPQPSLNDISHLMTTSKTQVVTVTGKVLSESRQTTNQKIQFWLASQQVSTSDTHQVVDGKLYVTLASSEKVTLHENQIITIKGILYLPKSSSIPGRFDFKAYLNRQGAFAGLKGFKIIELNQPPFGLWLFRERIVNALRQGLGDTYGSILGSIVLGRQAVDLPPEIRELFIKAGLAHVFAASGFQVTLLLGIVLRLTRSFAPRRQLLIGISVLVFYVSLTGLQASILRASLMGMGALIGMSLNRKTYSLGSLVLAGTLLLLFNPLWIWDLGFQLSFLATFGLIVTLPTLLRWFDWSPPTIATIVTLPIAASVWTFPLLIYNFSIVLTYSILVNIITAPLITVISFGGMLSAGISLLLPSLGSLVASLFYYPIAVLLSIVLFFNNLPGSTYAVGKVPLGLMLLIYGLMILLWLNAWFRRYWFLSSLFILSILIVTVTYARLSLVQITVLDSVKEPIMIFQDRGKVILINGDDDEAIKYTLLPFLIQQGINQIDTAISLKYQADWTKLAKIISVKDTKHLAQNQEISLGDFKLSFIQPDLVQLFFKEQKWFWVLSQTLSEKMTKKNLTYKPDVLLWSSKNFDENWLKIIRPQAAITFNHYPNKSILNLLEKQQIQFYWTGKNEAIQWSLKKGIQSYSSDFN